MDEYQLLNHLSSIDVNYYLQNYQDMNKLLTNPENIRSILSSLDNSFSENLYRILVVYLSDSGEELPFTFERDVVEVATQHPAIIDICIRYIILLRIWYSNT